MRHKKSVLYRALTTLFKYIGISCSIIYIQLKLRYISYIRNHVILHTYKDNQKNSNAIYIKPCESRNISKKPQVLDIRKQYKRRRYQNDKNM